VPRLGPRELFFVRDFSAFYRMPLAEALKSVR